MGIYRKAQFHFLSRLIAPPTAVANEVTRHFFIRYTLRKGGLLPVPGTSIIKRIFFALILLSLLPLALISLLTAYIGKNALKIINAQHYMAITQEKAERISDEGVTFTIMLPASTDTTD